MFDRSTYYFRFDCGVARSIQSAVHMYVVVYDMDPTSIAWYRNTLCIASRMVSLPRNENEKLDKPPLTRAPFSMPWREEERGGEREGGRGREEGGRGRREEGGGGGREGGGGGREGGRGRREGEGVREREGGKEREGERESE